MTFASGAASVLPTTHVDKNALRVDITFEYTWQTPLQVVLAYLGVLK